MSAAELMPRLLAALYLVAAGAALAAWIGWRLAAQVPTALRWTGIAVAAMFVATVAFHALVPLSLFTLPVALAGATVALAALWRDRGFLRSMLARETRVARRALRRLRASPRRGWLIAFAVCAAPVALRSLMVPPFAWDTLSYHGVKAAFWVQHGGPALVLDGPGTWDFNRNLFAGGEIFQAWAMLPLRGDVLVGPAQTLQWLCLGIALCATARELGAREPWASAAAALVLTCATVRLEVGTGYVEVVLAMVTAGAFAFTLRFLRRGEPGVLILAGAAYGVACGIKLIAMPVAGVGLAFLGVAAGRRRAWRAGAAAALTCACAAAPWMIHNVVDTGAPLSPAPVTVAGLELGRATATARVAMDRPDLKPYDLKSEMRTLERTFQGPSGDRECLGAQILVAMAVFVLSWPLLLWRRRAGALFLLLAAAANVAVIFSSGMAAVRLNWPESASRFWIAAVCAAVPASVAWCTSWPALGRAYLYFLVGASLFLLLRFAPLGLSYEYGFDAVMWAAGGVAAVVLVASWLPAGRARALGGTLAAVLAFTACAVHRDRNRYQAAAYEYVLHNAPHDVLAAAERLDDGRAHRVAVTAGHNRDAASWLLYTYFGRRLQNELIYVPPTASGAIEHDDMKLAEVADEAAWSARLEERGITDVVSLPPATIELGWMEKSPARFARLAGAPGNWGVFKIKP